MMHWSMFVMVLTLDSTVKLSLHDRKRKILGMTDATTPIFSRNVCTYVVYMLETNTSDHDDATASVHGVNDDDTT